MGCLFKAVHKYLLLLKDLVVDIYILEHFELTWREKSIHSTDLYINSYNEYIEAGRRIELYRLQLRSAQRERRGGIRTRMSDQNPYISISIRLDSIRNGNAIVDLFASFCIVSGLYLDATDEWTLKIPKLHANMRSTIFLHVAHFKIERYGNINTQFNLLAIIERLRRGKLIKIIISLAKYTAQVNIN